MTITEFLNARYDEDEEAVTRWDIALYEDNQGVPAWIINARGLVSPDHSLADIAAKRAIVAWCSERDKVYIGGNGWDDPTDLKSYIDGDYRRPGDTPILRMLVQPYAAHPDFDPRWAA